MDDPFASPPSSNGFEAPPLDGTPVTSAADLEAESAPERQAEVLGDVDPVDSAPAPPDAGPAPSADADDVDLEALAAIEAELADVELALHRLDDGTYGRCEVCDGPIDEALLTESPAVRTCRPHLPISLS